MRIQQQKEEDVKTWQRQKLEAEKRSVKRRIMQIQKVEWKRLKEEEKRLAEKDHVEKWENMVFILFLGYFWVIFWVILVSLFLGYFFGVILVYNFQKGNSISHSTHTLLNLKFSKINIRLRKWLMKQRKRHLIS